MRLYLAGPLFTTAERAFNSELAGELALLGHKVFLPQDECRSPAEHGIRATYEDCIDGIRACDAMVAILDGSDTDSGTAFELGWGRQSNVKLVGVRTDLRGGHEDRGLNLMIGQCLDCLVQARGLSIREVAIEVSIRLGALAG